ncbi:MAG: SDR family oxidoreductase [Deltaproteobacteria bacterium]|nr:SDR family oxidoreductase [Deltaproteobacteria bacterium]
MKLKNSVVLVTGGAKRVGKAIVTELAQAGAKLLIHYNTSEKEAKALAKSLNKKFGVVCKILQANLQKEEEIKRLAQEAWQAFGQVDALVHNASTFYPTPLGKTTWEEWEDLMGSNARAVFFLSQALGPKMKKKGQGKMIHLGDWSTTRPHPDYIPYNAAKAAMMNLAQAFARALAPEVQVNTLLPGPILWSSHTSESAKKKILQKTLLKRHGSPKDIAKTVRFLLEDSDFITGAQIHVDGGRNLY